MGSSVRRRRRVGGIILGAGASASAELLTLATADGWTGLWQPPNTNTQTFRNDGSNDFWSELGNGVAATPDLNQSTAAEQPQVGNFNDAMLYTGTEWMDLGTGTVGTTGLFAEAAQKFTVFCVFRAAAGTDGTLIARAGVNSPDRTFQLFLTNEGAGTDVLRVFLRGQTSVNLGGVDPRDNNWHVVMVRWNGGSAIARFDKGAEQGLGVGTAAEETGENIIIGARTNGAGFFLQDGALGTQIINDFSMTSAKQDEVFDLLMDEWGIS